jgi:hypothetical protein
VNTRFEYSWLYKLNFIPGVLYISFFLVIVAVSKSKPGTEIYGYITFSTLLIAFIVLVVLERLKVAKRINATDEGIVANNYFCKRYVYQMGRN